MSLTTVCLRSPTCLHVQTSFAAVQSKKYAGHLQLTSHQASTSEKLLAVLRPVANVMYLITSVSPAVFVVVSASILVLALGLAFMPLLPVSVPGLLTLVSVSCHLASQRTLLGIHTPSALAGVALEIRMPCLQSQAPTERFQSAESALKGSRWLSVGSSRTLHD